MDLDLAQIHLGFQRSKSLDLKFHHKPKNLEIPRPTLTLVLSSQFFIGYSVTLSLPSFSSFSFSQQGLSLSTLIFFFILSISLFLLNLNHKGFGVFCGFHFFFCGFVWVSSDLCVGFVWDSFDLFMGFVS